MKAGEEMWLVETPRPSNDAAKNAVPGPVQVLPRSRKAQIVGTVSFANSSQYRHRAAFHKDAQRQQEAAETVGEGGGAHRKRCLKFSELDCN